MFYVHATSFTFKYKPIVQAGKNHANCNVRSSKQFLKILHLVIAKFRIFQVLLHIIESHHHRLAFSTNFRGIWTQKLTNTLPQISSKTLVNHKQPTKSKRLLGIKFYLQQPWPISVLKEATTFSAIPKLPRTDFGSLSIYRSIKE